MKRIKKAAVLGAGVMGATIAAHLANAHIGVLLLDMIPGELTEAEINSGRTLADRSVRNRIATAGFEGLKKMKPAPYYLPENASYIEVGNFADDLERLRECDWVIEAVVENMEIKQQLLVEKVAPNLKESAILSTNTSGLSVDEMAEMLPQSLRKNFLITRFSNPPRYTSLLELVPGRHTEPTVVAFMAEFISRRLGKGIVSGQDTPSFIPNQISLAILKRTDGLVEQNSDASLVDLGDGVFCVEFHTKMNALGSGSSDMLLRGVSRAEEEGVGLVIANEGEVFSAGANLAEMSQAILAGRYGDIEKTIRGAQQTMLALKYSSVPVVAAPHSKVLGGGCEVCLHADAMNPHAETSMGLVEIGVGLLPAGGGTKELALRAIRLAEEHNVDITPLIIKNFMLIATGKVSSSAAELYAMGFLLQGDTITMNINRRIYDAKQKAIALAGNYLPSRPLTGLKAPGRSIAATIKAMLWNMRLGGYLSEYDEFLGATIAGVISGGDLPAGTLISEEYLLDLELEAFLGLCGQQKTRERIQQMLRTGKPLRN